MIERLEDNDPPRSSIRERLALLEARERQDIARARRHHHVPPPSMIWLVLVLLAALAAIWSVRHW